MPLSFEYLVLIAASGGTTIFIFVVVAVICICRNARRSRKAVIHVLTPPQDREEPVLDHSCWERSQLLMPALLHSFNPNAKIHAITSSKLCKPIPTASYQGSPCDQQFLSASTETTSPLPTITEQNEKHGEYITPCSSAVSVEHGGLEFNSNGEISTDVVNDSITNLPKTVSLNSIQTTLSSTENQILVQERQDHISDNGRYSYPIVPLTPSTVGLKDSQSTSQAPIIKRDRILRVHSFDDRNQNSVQSRFKMPPQGQKFPDSRTSSYQIAVSLKASTSQDGPSTSQARTRINKDRILRVHSFDDRNQNSQQSRIRLQPQAFYQIESLTASTSQDGPSTSKATTTIKKERILRVHSLDDRNKNEQLSRTKPQCSFTVKDVDLPNVTTRTRHHRSSNRAQSTRVHRSPRSRSFSGSRDYSYTAITSQEIPTGAHEPSSTDNQENQNCATEDVIVIDGSEPPPPYQI